MAQDADLPGLDSSSSSCPGSKRIASSQHVQEPRPFTIRRRRQPQIPVPEQQPHLIAQNGQFGESSVHVGESFAHERPHAPAWRRAMFALTKDAGKLFQGEPNHQRTANDSHPLDSGWRVATVTGSRSRWSSK
jgi:hypothetical protein